MNDLTIHTPAALDPVEVRSDRERYPRLYTIPAAIAVDEIAKAIQTASFYHGNRMTQDNSRAVAAALHLELMNNTDALSFGTQYITLTELSAIIKHAVLSNPDVTNLNVVVLYNAVIDWAQHEGAEIQRQAREKKIGANPLQKVCETWAGAMINNNQL